MPTVQKSITRHLIEGTIALYKEGEQPINAISVKDILKTQTLIRSKK
jgi:hypothetical protein